MRRIFVTRNQRGSETLYGSRITLSRFVLLRRILKVCRSNASILTFNEHNCYLQTYLSIYGKSI